MGSRRKGFVDTRQKVFESTKRVQDLKKQTLLSSAKADETLGNFPAAAAESNGSISKPILRQKFRAEEEEEQEKESERMREDGIYISDLNRRENGHSLVQKAQALNLREEPVSLEGAEWREGTQEAGGGGVRGGAGKGENGVGKDQDWYEGDERIYTRLHRYWSQRGGQETSRLVA